MLIQIVSIIGALLILGAYAAQQRGRTGPERASYNLANLVGALLLAWVAVVDGRIGFILLEGVWALVTLPSLFTSLRGRGGPSHEAAL